MFKCLTCTFLKKIRTKTFPPCLIFLKKYFLSILGSVWCHARNVCSSLFSFSLFPFLLILHFYFPFPGKRKEYQKKIAARGKNNNLEKYALSSWWWREREVRFLLRLSFFPYTMTRKNTMSISGSFKFVSQLAFQSKMTKNSSCTHAVFPILLCTNNFHSKIAA